MSDPTTSPPTETATLAGGCFWCTEAVFEQCEGVHQVTSGYIGGETENPTYKDICRGDTGHAEAVRVAFDPAVIPFAEILDIFFGTHDPTTLNRQGADVGTQYRSAVFFHTPEQEQIARAKIAELDAAGVFGGRIVTEVAPATAFAPAEDYHQEYYRNNPYQPYCMAVVGPKAAKFRKQFAHRLKGAASGERGASAP